MNVLYKGKWRRGWGGMGGMNTPESLASRQEPCEKVSFAHIPVISLSAVFLSAIVYAIFLKQQIIYH